MNSQWKFAVVVALKFVLFGEIMSKPIHTFVPDATYEDIRNLNATCTSRDNCNDVRSSDNFDKYNCICDSSCTQFGTCCVDSKYISNKPTSSHNLKCSEVYGDEERNVFMTDSCKPNWKGDDSVRELCNSNGEELDDPMLIIPVTNPETKITYKNHFCYVCNVGSDEEEPVSWDLKLQSKSEEVMSSSVTGVHYNPARKAWVIRKDDQDVEDSTVLLTVAPPKSLDAMVYSCLPDVISKCPWSWNDSSVRRKCNAYMAVTRIPKDDAMVLYRNPHCAICNFENIKDMQCVGPKKDEVAVSSKAFFTRIFSYHDKIKKCEKDKVYDVISKKCRRVFKGLGIN